MVQIPAGAEGTAIGVVVYAFICLTFNILMLCLLWTGNERRGFLILILTATFIATSTSIVSQIYDLIWYEDVMTARYRLIQAETASPVLAASDGSVGLDLVMWTVRWGCYIAEAGLGFFWAFSLTQSVYGWRDDARLHRALVVVNQAGKPFCVMVAAVTMCALQSADLQRSATGWNVLLQFFYAGFCACGFFMFLLILFEFIQTRRLFRRMNSIQRREYVQQPQLAPARGRSSSISTSVITAACNQPPPPPPPSEAAANTESFGALAQRQGGIYDKYLIARTFIPFIALCLFEIDNILINDSRPEKMRRIAASPGPDLSAATAISYYVNFVPGCAASLVLPLAFGTTRQFRERLLRAPSRFLERRRRRGYRRSPSTTLTTPPRYVDMDVDNGILSRQKRLSMEKRLRIEVTYEFEVRNERVEMTGPAAPPLGVVAAGAGAGAGEVGGLKDGAGSGGGGGGGAPGVGNGSRVYPYSVESHRWNDEVETVLPKKPSHTVLRLP